MVLYESEMVRKFYSLSSAEDKLLNRTEFLSQIAGWYLLCRRMLYPISTRYKVSYAMMIRADDDDGHVDGVCLCAAPFCTGLSVIQEYVERASLKGFHETMKLMLFDTRVDFCGQEERRPSSAKGM